jgi:hypothetical protein
MSTIFWEDKHYGIRRRSGRPVLLVVALCVVAGAAGAQLVSGPGGLDAPTAPAREAVRSIAGPSSSALTPPTTTPALTDPGAAVAPAGITPAAPPSSAPAAAAPDAPSQLRSVIAALPAIARASGARVQVGDAPAAPGHWGVYEATTNTVYIGRGAFASWARLRYVVAHELAHAYYFQVASAEGRAALDGAVAAGPAVAGGAPELVADCTAILWGATTWHYWSCPSPSRDAVAGLVPTA